MRELMTMFTELRGPRIAIRPLQPDFVSAIYPAIMESREELRPWLPFVEEYERPEGMENLRAFLIRSQADWLLRDNFQLSIWRSADEHYLGAIGLHPRNWKIPAFEIGYWLRTSASGQGYMTEAVRLLSDFAFSVFGAERLIIRCDARNARSAAVARRLGFIQEGHLRNDEMPGPDGKLRDTLIFARIPTDPPMP
ncbi:MAG: GNAT family N-acetyltransferase [Ktedonobacterales bacterium]|nr:GNAT family N-acetyltransferase [Ktedonobacterales bacterium]